VSTLVDTHNALLWNFRNVGFMTVVPRIYFSTAGVTGVNIQLIEGLGLGGIYAPSLYTVPLTEVLSQLNTLIGAQCGQLIFDGQRVSLIVQANCTIQFMDPSLVSYDSGLRMMRRLLPEDMASAYTGPTYVQGPLITGPIFGNDYPIPADVTNIVATPTAASIALVWTDSEGANVYYIHVVDTNTPSIVSTITTPETSHNVVGLSPDTDYTITIFAGTNYEISTGVTQNIRTTVIP
jgi:hypothetical protein